jgi:1,4-dihydroxy-6-naphthoate synthase
VTAPGAGREDGISLGYSPCPNDTFIFCALAEGRVDTGGVPVRIVLDDIEGLNRRALEGELEATKVSFHAYGHLRREWALLRSGAALGRGCGPLVVSRRPLAAEELASDRGGLRVAIPGELTTAALLLRLFAPGLRRFVVRPFHAILDAVLDGSADAGAIIHESRFTYTGRGLRQVADLGAWWEAATGLPIPLGAIIARRDLGPERIAALEGWVRASVVEARRDPEATRAYVRAHAQEMDEAVLRAHIALYVNEFTVDLGEEGLRAVEVLLARAEEREIIPRARPWSS